MRRFTQLAGWLLIIGLVGLIFASHRNRQVAASLPPVSAPQDSWQLLVAVTRQSEESLVEKGQLLSSAWANDRQIASQQVQGILQSIQEWRQKFALFARAQRVTAAQPRAAAQPQTSQVRPDTLLNNLPLAKQPAPAATPVPASQERSEPLRPIKTVHKPLQPAREASPVPHTSQPAERLRIPILHVDVPVVAIPFDQISWDLDDVQQEVALLGSLTGELSTRNLVIAGHVTLRNGSHGPFRYLHWLKPGDLLVIETDRTVQTFLVREQIVVKPEDVSVTENTPEQQLTLITCTDWSEELELFQRRRVVLADLVSIEPRRENHQ